MLNKLVKHNKECKTQFYIYNTTFYNYVEKLVDTVLAKKGWFSNIRHSIFGGYIDHVKSLLRVSGTTMDQLKKYIELYPTFLHIFEDA